jgi:hypothetical protein
MEDLAGGLQIVSQGRSNPPIVLVYVFNKEKQIYFYEIFRCPVTLMGLAEDPDAIMEAKSEQEAIDILNGTSDVAAADILIDLSEGRPAGGSKTKLLFKGTHPATKTAEWVQAYLQSIVPEVL